MKLEEITPQVLRCGVGPCPAVYKSDRGTFVIVGKRLTHDQVRDLIPGRVAVDEEAVELSKEFFSELGR